MACSARHDPVMVSEVMDALGIVSGMVVVDLTVGLGGHAREMFNHLGGNGILVGLDQDHEAIKIAKSKFTDEENKQIQWVHANFRDTECVQNIVKNKRIDACLMDLGVSSFQLDVPRRGFSFQGTGVLDMRMNSENCVTAKDILDGFSEHDLADVFYLYGQERKSRAIARSIAGKRRAKKDLTAQDLAQSASYAYRKMTRRRIHPATKIFQALRILVNDELNALADALPLWCSSLKPGGRMCVISYHSLEDGLVKNVFRTLTKEKRLRLVCKKPLVPSQEEVFKNPRSRSAKLRIVESCTHD